MSFERATYSTKMCGDTFGSSTDCYTCFMKYLNLVSWFRLVNKNSRIMANPIRNLN